MWRNRKHVQGGPLYHFQKQQQHTAAIQCCPRLLCPLERKKTRGIGRMCAWLIAGCVSPLLVTGKRGNNLANAATSMKGQLNNDQLGPAWHMCVQSTLPRSWHDVPQNRGRICRTTIHPSLV